MSDNSTVSKGKNRRQTIRQVWFYGVHTDVGGGHKQTGISDIPLCWMLDRATDEKVLEHPLRLFPYNWVKLEQNAEEVIHDSRVRPIDKRLFERHLSTVKFGGGGIETVVSFSACCSPDCG